MRTAPPGGGCGYAHPGGQCPLAVAVGAAAVLSPQVTGAARAAAVSARARAEAAQAEAKAAAFAQFREAAVVDLVLQRLPQVGPSLWGGPTSAGRPYGAGGAWGGTEKRCGDPGKDLGVVCGDLGSLWGFGGSLSHGSEGSAVGWGVPEGYEV